MKATTNTVAPTVSFEHSVINIRRWKQDATPLVTYIHTFKETFTVASWCKRRYNSGVIIIREGHRRLQNMSWSSMAQCRPSSLALEIIQRIVEGLGFNGCLYSFLNIGTRAFGYIFTRTGCESFSFIVLSMTLYYLLTQSLTVLVLK